MTVLFKYYRVVSRLSNQMPNERKKLINPAFKMLKIILMTSDQ